MRIFAYSSFSWHRFMSPEWCDFVDEGLGIEHRERRFRAVWAPHLRRSRMFLEKATEEGGDEVVVLGAGRLFDVPVKYLVERFDRVVLVDADPRVVACCRRSVRRWGQRVEVRHDEVTGVFSVWSRMLEAVCGACVEEVEAVLRSLRAPAQLWSSGTVVSMNLLSQFGVMWRDRVRRMVGADRLRVPEVGEATAQSIIQLEGAHALGLAAASRAVVLADRYFFTEREQAHRWEREDALYGEWPEHLPDKETWLSGSWLWQIVPMNGEVTGEGIIHEVWARAFRDVRG